VLSFYLSFFLPVQWDEVLHSYKTISSYILSWYYTQIFHLQYLIYGKKRKKNSASNNRIYILSLSSSSSDHKVRAINYLFWPQNFVHLVVSTGILFFEVWKWVHFLIEGLLAHCTVFNLELILFLNITCGARFSLYMYVQCFDVFASVMVKIQFQVCGKRNDVCALCIWILYSLIQFVQEVN
jgi:hypothetical protein